MIEIFQEILELPEFEPVVGMNDDGRVLLFCPVCGWLIADYDYCWFCYVKFSKRVYE